MMSTSSGKASSSSSSSSDPSPLSFLTLLKIYTAVAIVHLLKAKYTQTQFDPDEYWQTLEPAYCLAFTQNSNVNTFHKEGESSHPHNCAYTWEWTRSRSNYHEHEDYNDDNRNSFFVEMLQNVLHGPVRSYVSILPTFWFYKFVQFFAMDTTYVIAHGPLYCNALLVSAPTDVAIFCIARWVYNSSGSSSSSSSSSSRCNNLETIKRRSYPFLALFASITNWFHSYALIRTYSNSVETVLLTVGIALLSPELFSLSSSCQHTIHQTTKKEKILRKNAKIAFVLGGISVAIRFTSLAAWIPIGLIISFRGKYTAFQDGLSSVWTLCALYGGLGLMMACIVDWYFYGKVVIPFLGNFHFNVMLGMFSLIFSSF